MKVLSALPDLDRDIYDLLAACAAAGIPLTFCGNDVTRKHELQATLCKSLSRHRVDAATVRGLRGRFTVTPDHA